MCSRHILVFAFTSADFVRQILDYLESVRDTLVVVLGDFNDWLPGRSAAHVLVTAWAGRRGRRRIQSRFRSSP